MEGICNFALEIRQKTIHQFTKQRSNDSNGNAPDAIRGTGSRTGSEFQVGKK